MKTPSGEEDEDDGIIAGKPRPMEHQLMNPSPAMGQCQTKAAYGKSVRAI